MKKQSSPSNAPIAFMFLMPVVVMVLFAIFYKGHNYSPLDNYIKATIESDSLNHVSYMEGLHFIDSVNNK